MAVETRHSVCALDCPDACALKIDVENEHGSRLRGDPAHPVTQGFLCAKVARYLQHEYSPERVLYPQRRVGAKGEGKFIRISWDEALDRVAAGLQEAATRHGTESVLPYSYAGNMGYLNNSGMDHRFFHRFGASRLDRTICSSAGGAGLMEALGYRYGTEPEQFVHSRLILAWGANVLSTNVHLWPFIVEARRRGARFYVIDPHRNRTAALADRHFAIQPGSDPALALGMMHVILRDGLEDADYVTRHTTGIDDLRSLVSGYPPSRVAEQTGIPAGDIEMLAREYATIRPAVIRVNYGVQRSERGGLAVRAIARLPALVGAWKEPGGGLQLSTSGAFQVNRAGLQMPELQHSSPLGKEARLVNMSQLGDALNHLADPPVQAILVYNSNPAAVAPNQNAVLQGFRREDLFTVVLEQMQTDTADHADILLPVTTFLEQKDLYLAYGHYYLQMADAVLPAPGECLSNTEIFRRLARRLGFSEPCFEETEDDMIRGLLHSGHPFLQGITFERLKREHFVRLNISPAGSAFLPFAEGNFGTPSGKCEFRAETLAYEPPVESRHGDPHLKARFPLELISPKNHDSMNSTFGNRPAVARSTAVATVHPQDAAARGLATGDTIRMFNARGSVTLPVAVSSDIRQGVACVPSVRWPKSSPEARNVNALTSERLTDIGGGPVFYSCMVEIEKVEI